MNILLVFPSTFGSLGDEAVSISFLDALQERGPGHHYYLFEYAKNSWSKYYHRFKKIIFIPGYLTGMNRRLNLIEKIRLKKIDKVIVLGTDVMDGHYSEPRSLNRLRILRELSELGAMPYLVNFSWNKNPTEKVLQELYQHGLKFSYYIRENESLNRFKELFPDFKVKQTADIAFLLKPSVLPSDMDQKLKQKTLEGYRIIGININYQIFKTYQNYLLWKERIINFLKQYTLFATEHKIFTCFLPHDIRGEVNDWSVNLDVIREAGFSSENYLIPEMKNWSAMDNKALVARCDLILTGRMHISIAALGSSVPVILLDYQDKGTGLFKLFGLESMVKTSDIFDQPDDLITEIGNVLSNKNHYSDSIRKNLDQIRELSQVQVRGVLEE